MKQQTTNLKTTDRKRLFNQVVDITGIEIELKKDRCRVIFVTKEHENITYKITRTVEKTSHNEELDIDITETIEEPITKANLGESLPTVVRLLADEIKKNKKAKCHITYSESTIEDNNGEEQTYRYMFKTDVETIYCEKIHGDDNSNIEKQLEKEQNRKNRMSLTSE